MLVLSEILRYFRQTSVFWQISHFGKLYHWLMTMFCIWCLYQQKLLRVKNEFGLRIEHKISKILSIEKQKVVIVLLWILLNFLHLKNVTHLLERLACLIFWILYNSLKILFCKGLHSDWIRLYNFVIQAWFFFIVVISFYISHLDD